MAALVGMKHRVCYPYVGGVWVHGGSGGQLGALQEAAQFDDVSAVMIFMPQDSSVEVDKVHLAPGPLKLEPVVEAQSRMVLVVERCREQGVMDALLNVFQVYGWWALTQWKCRGLGLPTTSSATHMGGPS